MLLRYGCVLLLFLFFFSSRRRHTRCLSDWSSDVCSSDLSTVVVQPTLDPNKSPLALLQAMACGVPVLASDLPRLAHVVRDARSEERRVGKECRSRRSRDPSREKEGYTRGPNQQRETATRR